ncbi:hypothetical protein [Vibrio splendidus]|uniref:hypothetical protein n=1 Tax=Vibrio splendidus TaxID=29497 RepID=UPI003D0BB10D
MKNYSEMTIEELDAIKPLLITAYKLLNTLDSKSFKSHLKTNWKWSTNQYPQVYAVCEEKANAEISYTLKHHNPEFSKAVFFLNWFTERTGIKIKKSETKGLLHNSNLEDLNNLMSLIYEHTGSTIYNSDIEVGRFTFHEFIHAFINYRSVRIGIEQGLPPKIQKAFDSMLNTKPVIFFKKGYITDLFLLDALNEIQLKDKFNLLRCAKTHLSTWRVDEVDQNDNYHDYYHLSAA